MKIGGRASETERRGVADGDMLIYELQGFAAAIPSSPERGKVL